MTVLLLALFHSQRLFGRAMSVRLDRWNDVKPQAIPRTLPAGLESIGMGLGIGGQPLQRIGQIASMYLLLLTEHTHSTLSLLHTCGWIAE